MDFLKILSRKGGVIFVSLFFLGGQLSGESEITLKGTVLYSFTEPHTLIQTEGYVARIILQNLDKKQRRDLLKVGSQVKVNIPRTAVDLVWPINPNQNETLVIESAVRPTKLEEAVGEKNKVHVEGKILTAFGKSERLIQVGSYIYRINLKLLSRETRIQLTDAEGSVTVAIPSKAIVFAWKMEPETDNGRAPAGATTKESVEFKDGQVTITGRSVASFTEPHVLVHSSGKIYQLIKKFLSKEELVKTSRIGDDVTVQVPTKAVQYHWSAEP